MDKTQKQTMVQGHKVFYSQDAQDGVNYLVRLSRDEAKVYFDQAYLKGTASFEDHMAKNFKLTKKNYDFELTRI